MTSILRMLATLFLLDDRIAHLHFGKIFKYSFPISSSTDILAAAIFENRCLRCSATSTI